MFSFTIFFSVVDGHHLWETEAKVVREFSKSVSDASDSCYCEKLWMLLGIKRWE